MAIWIEAFVVEDLDGGFLELFGDETQAEQYVELFTSDKWGADMRIRETIVDIENYTELEAK